MFSSSRGILYTAPPADEEAREKRPTDDADEDAAPEPVDSTPEPTVEDTAPAASRANWTGDVPADD